MCLSFVSKLILESTRRSHYNASPIATRNFPQDVQLTINNDLPFDLPNNFAVSHAPVHDNHLHKPFASKG